MGRNRDRGRHRQRFGGPFGFGGPGSSGFGNPFGFGGWGGRRFFGPGELRLALLSLLSEAPKHGYELMKDLEARSGGTYRASAGSIYPALQQLQDEGLVSSAAEDVESQSGRRVFRLTKTGERVLEDEEATVQRIWRRADEWGEWGQASLPEALEISRPAMRLVKAALSAVSRAGNDPDRIEEVREVLEQTAEELEGLADRD